MTLRVGHCRESVDPVVEITTIKARNRWYFNILLEGGWRVWLLDFLKSRLGRIDLERHGIVRCAFWVIENDPDCVGDIITLKVWISYIYHNSTATFFLLNGVTWKRLTVCCCLLQDKRSWDGVVTGGHLFILNKFDDHGSCANLIGWCLHVCSRCQWIKFARRYLNGELLFKSDFRPIYKLDEQSDILET